MNIAGRTDQETVWDAEGRQRGRIEAPSLDGRPQATENTFGWWPMDQESTDDQLLASLPGDPHALEVLYGRWGPRVARLAQWLGVAESELPDLVQTIFADLWQEAGRFDPSRGPAKNWIYRLARQRSIDHLRRLRTRPALASSHEDLGGRSASDLTDRLAVREALFTLSERERAVLQLAYFGGFTQQEIATAWKVPLGTVKTWSRRALEKLRERVSEQEEEQP